MNCRIQTKILIATSFPPDAPGGSPWMLYQLLRGYPPDKVAWWSIGGEPPLHAKERVGTYASGKIPGRLVPHRRYTQVKSFLLESFWVPKAADELRSFIRREKPDLLWILAFSWAIPVLHRVIPKAGIPWHISLHDLADSAGLVASQGVRRTGRFQGMLDDLYAGALSRDVYMQETATEMKKRTGYDADLILRCGAEPEEIARLKEAGSCTPGDKIRIGYPGTIIAEDTFARFIAAIKRLSLRVPLPIEVHLFGIHSYKDRSWYDPDIIIENGYLSEEELDRRYRSCDYGLVIMELDDSNPRYSRFTFPCKFTKAVATGLPVISIGHPDCTLIRFAGRYRLGPVITWSDPEMIASALADYFTSVHDQEEIKERTLHCIDQEFHAQKNRELLHGLFQRSAKHES